MSDVLVDSLDIEVLIVLTNSIDKLHPECVLQDLLRSLKEDILVFIGEVERFRKDPEELWLLEGDTEPLVNNKLIKKSVELNLSQIFVLGLQRVCQNTEV